MKDLGEIFYEKQNIKLSDLSTQELNEILTKIQQQKSESKTNIDLILNRLLNGE